MTKTEVADLIVRFINDDGEIGDYEWDDFISCRHSNPEIEAVRMEVCDVEERHRPSAKAAWTTEEGLVELRAIADRLNAEANKPI